MRTKICGINSIEDIDVAIRAGADALGFLVGITHLAEDKISNEDARVLIEKLPPFISTVAVTHLTNVNEIVELVRYLGVTTVQIHDYIPPEDVRIVRDSLRGIKIIKAVHVMEMNSIKIAKSFEPFVDAILLDSRTKDRLGGTGITHDWNISELIVKEIRRPIILAGGLTADNIFDAVKKVKPFAVDVNSGVETDNRKDFNKVSKFILDAKRAESEYY
ncbi:MAG: phosphoribosylanthranilate isomerase [Syntrophomonas sp.]